MWGGRLCFFPLPGPPGPVVGCLCVQPRREGGLGVGMGVAGVPCLGGVWGEKQQRFACALGYIRAGSGPGTGAWASNVATLPRSAGRADKEARSRSESSAKSSRSRFGSSLALFPQEVKGGRGERREAASRRGKQKQKQVLSSRRNKLFVFERSALQMEALVSIFFFFGVFCACWILPALGAAVRLARFRVLAAFALGSRVSVAPFQTRNGSFSRRRHNSTRRSIGTVD